MPFRILSALSLAAMLAAVASPTAAQNGAVPLIAAADPAVGEKLFIRCKACHTTDKGGRHRLGPNLWNVVGRAKAAARGFGYSPALRALGGVWDYTALDGYLADPKKFAPGNRMAFPGLKPDSQRAAVIAYLRTLSDAPRPLPRVAAAPPPSAAVDRSEPQDFGGLPPGDGREETHAICGACHSLRLVTQQGLSANRWDELMDWMVERQGMAELKQDERRRIVSYLAKFYGPESRARQRVDPMSPAMPPMPTMPPSP